MHNSEALYDKFMYLKQLQKIEYFLVNLPII